MFICMVVNDALQLSLVTALYVVSYIFRKIHTSVCCFLVSHYYVNFMHWVLLNPFYRSGVNRSRILFYLEKLILQSPL